MVKTRVEQSLGANPADAALNAADSVAMGVPAFRAKGHRTLFRALAHREFRLLCGAFLINQTGFWVSHLSLQALTVELSENDPMAMGMIFFAMFLPAFVIAPLAGVAADRFDRKRIIVICYGAVVAIVGSLAWMTAMDLMTMPRLLGVAFVLGTAFAFSGPANMAIAANSVPEEDLASAVSLQSALNNLTRVVGPALAAPVIASGRFEISFAIFAGSALVAGVLVTLMRLSPYEREDDNTGIIVRMASGLEHARARHPAFPALVTVAVLTLFGISHVSLLPVHAEVVLGDIGAFAWVVVATGTGALIGSLVTGLRGASLRSSGIQVALYGLALAIFTLNTNFAAALVLQAVIGFAYFSVMTGLQTLIQQVVDEARRGRVMSLFQVCWAGLIPFGSLGMGAAADSFGLQNTLIASSSVCILYGVGFALRHATEEAPDAGAAAQEEIS